MNEDTSQDATQQEVPGRAGKAFVPAQPQSASDRKAAPAGSPTHCPLPADGGLETERTAPQTITRHPVFDTSPAAPAHDAVADTQQPPAQPAAASTFTPQPVPLPGQKEDD